MEIVSISQWIYDFDDFFMTMALILMILEKINDDLYLST